MAQSSVILKAVGLITSPNQLSLPDGSLAEATNVIISRDNVVEPRRGFKLYGDALPSSSDRIKQLFEYRQRIFRHFNDSLQYDNGNGKFLDISGSFTEPSSGLRIKTVEARGNLYLTTADGVKKISVKNSSDFDNQEVVVEDTGVVKALDFQPELNYTYTSKTGFLPQDSAVAYRILWNRNDNNGNLIRGTASQREEIYNPLKDLLIKDFVRILDALDVESDNSTTAKIGDADYTSTLKLPITATALELRTNVVALSAKLDEDIFLADNTTSATLEVTSANISSGELTITFSASPIPYLSSGSKIELRNFATGVDLDGEYDIVSITATDIVVATSEADGAVTLDQAEIYYNEYRSLVEPLEVTIPETTEQLVSIQAYIDGIITQLNNEPTTIIDNSSSSAIAGLDITTTTNVDLRITIPENITTDYFYQVYRSNTIQALGAQNISDVVPDDEMSLVIEDFPTDAQITSGIIEVTDNTLDILKGEFLYSNETTGEGILQSNDVPPFAKDINRYRNVVFYANTRTIHRLNAQLIGLDGLLQDVANSVTPTLTIADDNETVTFSFVSGSQEVTEFTINTKPGDGTSITLPTVGGNFYKIWFDDTGSTTEPTVTIPAGYTEVSVQILTSGLTNDEIASSIADRMSVYLDDVFTDVSTNVITFTQTKQGEVEDASEQDSGITAPTIVTQGVGENAADNKVLLSSSPSTGIAIDETARSLVRVINQNDDSPVYAYYTSTSTSSPGQFVLEKRQLDEIPFFLVTNTGTSGASFSPDLSPENTISAIDTGTDIITSTSPHNLVNGDVVVITNSDTVPSIDGAYTVVIEPTFTSSEFKLSGVDITTVNTVQGSFINGSNAQISDNEENKNRIYYSKFQQPEAVPIVNFFDVGAREKAILRIFPLRDSLFVFKEDGLFRISGEVAPFTNALFDSSCILLAPDSIGVSNNLIYGWTTQGIQAISESGVDVVSREIDDTILKLSSSNYTNFRTATWGVGYESDNSYVVYTVSNTSDTVATLAYRYSNQTGTWTNFDQSTTCGIINDTDDKMYLGAADVPYIEVERKSFDRTDYADREVTSFMRVDKYNGTEIFLDSVTGLSVGDVVVQNQGMTLYAFNSLLRQLDQDPSVGDTDYESVLELESGESGRTAIVNLANKLDADSGVNDTDYFDSISSKNGTITKIESGSSSVITSVGHGLVDGRVVTISGSDSVPDVNGDYVVTVIDADNFSIPTSVRIKGASGTFVTSNTDLIDQTACFNKIVDKLNADSGVFFSNYDRSDYTQDFESPILAIDTVTNKITLKDSIQFLVGNLVIHKAINSSFTYSPTTMGDPLHWKNFIYASGLLQYNNVTKITMSFASDLFPGLEDVVFDRDSNGAFGSGSFGGGFFGGQSNSAPLNTIIPVNAKRGRYIVVKISHSIARESYAFFGVTITANITSSFRTYRN